jgi:hypothetical protein
MYEKVGKLSMKSLIETNSGKLITLISADMFQVERGLVISPVVFAAPFVNLLCYIFIGISVGWWYSLAIFLAWIITFMT